MKRLPTKYVAGLFDGEGCINIKFGKNTILPRVIINLVEPSSFVLEMVKNTFKGNIYHKENTNDKWQGIARYEITGFSKVCCFLREIKNFLYIKREQAEFILALEKLVKGKPQSQEVLSVIKEELKLMKSDPHRLSDKAVERLLQML